jgi:hypothetical protein
MVDLEASQPHTTRRKLLALANWQNAMTVEESLAFVRDFPAMAGDLLEVVDVVICQEVARASALSGKVSGGFSANQGAWLSKQRESS